MMSVRAAGSLLSLPTQYKTIPIIENRMQFVHVLDSPSISAILLRHCNLFELSACLEQAYARKRFIYVNVDHIDGIHPDASGLNYLAHHLHVTGVISSNPRVLMLAKQTGIETCQRVFALDSTGLEATLDAVDSEYVDLLDISPALVVPHVIPYLSRPLPLPFMASGLIYNHQQVQAVLRSGAVRVAVAKSDLWQT
ncbi:MAG TPA: glycerol-3-phosphate responsive antiterminator [Ktedonobacteraceae bacterium]|jgi:glycerol-3-phosphate responsive antiterminator|nr:glycerol-3-phosphate responsive antiterminator [Ktedonobacteraceae bacterium]